MNFPDFLLCLLMFLMEIKEILTSGSGNADCVDKNAPGRASDCPLRKDLCNNPLYQQLMADQCPTTCKIGKCGKKNDNGTGSGSGSGNDNCKDKNAPGRASDCPMMKAYCTNPIYETLMRDQCPTTCGVGSCGKKKT